MLKVFLELGERFATCVFVFFICAQVIYWRSGGWNGCPGAMSRRSASSPCTATSKKATLEKQFPPSQTSESTAAPSSSVSMVSTQDDPLPEAESPAEHNFEVEKCEVKEENFQDVPEAL